MSGKRPVKIRKKMLHCSDKKIIFYSKNVENENMHFKYRYIIKTNMNYSIYIYIMISHKFPRDKIN